VAEWVRNNPYLTSAWALDRSVTTAETVARGRHRLDGELAKIDEEWSLSVSSTNPCRGKAAVRAPRASFALAAGALRTAQEEAEQLLRERQASTIQGWRSHQAPFRRWRNNNDDGTDDDGDDDNDDDTDDNSGAAGQGAKRMRWSSGRV
jgi:hypothetical protein